MATESELTQLEELKGVTDSPDRADRLAAALAYRRLGASAEAIGAFDKRVITYCGGGIAASADALALVMLGHPDVRLYDASLSEWAIDPSLPMETG